MLLYEDLDMIDFLNSEDPYPMLTNMNKIVLDKEAQRIFEEHAGALKPPSDLQFMIDDIKNCGRRDMQHLLRLRHKYKQLMYKID
jgi:hypothetical protein